MRIGEVAEASGVSARSLRYYEEQELIGSCRTSGGWRDFDPETVERVIMIQHLLAAGLGTGTIRELLPCLEAPPSERTSVMDALLTHEVARLEARRREIDRELEVLRDLREDVSVSRVDAGRAVIPVAAGAGRA